MLKSLIRTIRGPSQDPLMAYISRPLPRGLTDDQMLAALELAFEANPNPAALVETLPDALRQVTGRSFQVLDRSVQDVTRAFILISVMVRDGPVGLWPGHAARAYPLLKPSAKAEETRRAIVAAEDSEAAGPSPTNPVGKPGWAPPPDIEPEPPKRIPMGGADVASSKVMEVH